MSTKSKIEWTHRNGEAGGTWNPLLGCDKVSDGCTHCYAILQCWIKQHNPNPKIKAAFEGLVEQRPDGSLNWTGKVRELPERLAIPFKQKAPTTWFVNSLSDLFHEDVSDDFIAQVFGVMALTPHHTYQILTKRPDRMLKWFTGKRLLENTAEYVAWWASKLPGLPEIIWDSRGSDIDRYWNIPMSVERSDDDPDKRSGNEYRPMTVKERTVHCAKRRAWPGWPLPNVWIGVSAENQKTADERIPLLLKTPAVIRFLSCEPLLGPIQLGIGGDFYDYGVGKDESGGPKIHQVIAGGESGKDSRPMHPEWAMDLRDQCQEAGVAFFFKQWGDWQPRGDEHGCWSVKDSIPGKEQRHVFYTPHPNMHTPVTVLRSTPHPERGEYYHQWMMQRVGKHAAGRILDGRTWDEFPVAS